MSAEISSLRRMVSESRLSGKLAQDHDGLLWEVLRLDQPGPKRVVDIVVDVGDAVGRTHDLAFEGRGLRITCVVEYPVPDLPGKVQASALVFQNLDHAKALNVVVKLLGARKKLGERALPYVSERCMPQVVSERYRLREVLVEPQGASYGA
jgi:hypothetical protein